MNLKVNKNVFENRLDKNRKRMKLNKIKIMLIRKRNKWIETIRIETKQNINRQQK